MFEYVIVIPARLRSTRLPNKPLLQIEGKTLIQRTFERALMASNFNNIFITTDSKKIKKECQKFTDNIILTSKKCLTGTDRIAEFANFIKSEVYINFQGDEPIMPIENLKKIISISVANKSKIYNGYADIIHENEYKNNSIPKLTTDKKNKLLYMSRSSIPGNKYNLFKSAKKQICLYGYNKDSLKKFYSNKKTPNEEIEDIEILRFLEIGLVIQMVKMNPNTIAVDTHDDLEKVRKIIRSQGERIPTYKT